MAGVMDLVSYVVKTAAESGIEHMKKEATHKVEEISKTIKTSVSEGIVSAMEISIPMIKKNAFYLVGSAFLLFGMAELIDVIVRYKGVGFIAVGILSLVIGLLVKGKPRYSES